MNTITQYTFLFAAVVLSLSVHEFSHALAAYKLGDPTARMAGRLTLNPMRHIDPLGALAMLFLHIGWARPVPINVRYFRRPKRDMALSAAAGPLSNLILSFLSAFLFCLTEAGYEATALSALSSPLLLRALSFIAFFFYVLHTVNLSLMLFNLLPFPPLDGSRVLGILLPGCIYYRLMSRERQIYYGFLLWLLLGSFAVRLLSRVSLIAASPIFPFVASVLSPSYLISIAANALSSLMLRLFSLIPFLS